IRSRSTLCVIVNHDSEIHSRSPGVAPRPDSGNFAIRLEPGSGRNDCAAWTAGARIAAHRLRETSSTGWTGGTPVARSDPVSTESRIRMSLREHRAWLVLAIALGVVLGLGGFTFRYAEGLSYFSTDPKACANCHIMRRQYDGWQKASHHGAATCADCHLP